MILLTQITDKGKQKYTIVVDDGSVFEFYLRYLPTQESWVFDIIYNNFSVYNLLLTNSINCLHAYKNLLPFGIMCFSNDGGDPQNIDDFTTGRCKIYVMNQADLNDLEATFFE